MPATDCAILILAAGNSSRLGTPKQLLMFEGRMLLQHAVDEAMLSGIDEVTVVTGANHNTILSSLPDAKVDFVYNEHWQQGMASSIQAGLSAILAKHPDLNHILIMLCDQPFVSYVLLQEIITQKNMTGKGIIACEYKKTIGVPVLFSRTYFDALLSLQGTEGAKKIITANTTDTALVSFPQGAVDIDTKEDYERLIK